MNEDEKLRFSERDPGALRDRLREVEAERDALAAHVECLTDALKHHRVIHDYHSLSNGDERLKGAHDEMEAALVQSPTTSLARRDARMKAEALEHLVEASKYWALPYASSSYLSEKAAEYRQQAEGGGDA